MKVLSIAMTVATMLVLAAAPGAAQSDLGVVHPRSLSEVLEQAWNPVADVPSVRRGKQNPSLFRDVVDDYGRLFRSRDAYLVLGLGLGGSLSVKPFDERIAKGGFNSELPQNDGSRLDTVFESGTVLGGSLVQVGGAFATYGLAARGESRSYEGSTQSIRRTTLTRMAMGTRETDQPPLWIATSDLPTSPGHPFYARLTTLLDGHHVDRFVEGLCDRFYAPVMGRPSLAPGRYFRLLLVGYFEGIDSERGMAWRATDSLAVRSFLRLAVDEAPPDHSTIARTRRLIDLETHRTVFTWVQQRLVEAGRLTGKTIAIDATTLEANAAMRSIVRRDTGESYQAFLAGLATASGVETPTREGLARLDRKRKKKTSNTDWTHPHDPDAKVTKMKDGRTHLAHKAEHAVDMETGAIVAVTLQGADVGDTTTIIETAIAAAEQVEDAQANVDDRQSLEEIVGDKGYHSNQTLIDLDAVGIRSYVSEPDRGRRDWSKDPEARAPVYGNRRRMRGRRGRRLMRQRGERIERSFAHLYDTGGMRRTHLRGHTNILKRLLIHAGGFNLGLVMRHLIGIGTPRGLQGRVAAVRATLGVLMGVVRRRLTTISSSHRLIPAVRGRLASLATFAVNSSAAITCTTGC